MSLHLIIEAWSTLPVEAQTGLAWLVDNAARGSSHAGRHAVAAGGPLSATGIAEKYQLNSDTVRHALQKWRQTNFVGWIEVTNRASRDPQYLYYEAAISPLLARLTLATDPANRPAKKNAA